MMNTQWPSPQLYILGGALMLAAGACAGLSEPDEQYDGVFALRTVNGTQLPRIDGGGGAPGEVRSLDSATVSLSTPSYGSVVIVTQHYRYTYNSGFTTSSTTMNLDATWAVVGRDSISFDVPIFSATGASLRGDSLTIAAPSGRYVFLRK